MIKCKYCQKEFRDWRYEEIYESKTGQVWELRCQYCNKVNYKQKFKKIKLK